MTSPVDKPSFFRSIRGSLIGVLVLLFVDAAWLGTYLYSFMICPIWFLVSVVRSTIHRPGWTIALVRLAIPAVTLWIVLTNDTFQRKVAAENAEKVIAACEEFHSDKGKYPKELNELVPRYMPSVPPAKHCLGPFGRFLYLSSRENHMLIWFATPPYGRKDYDFEEKEWGYLD